MYHNSHTAADTRDAPPDYYEATNSLHLQPGNTYPTEEGRSLPPGYQPSAYATQYGAEYGFDNASYKDTPGEQPYSITTSPNFSQVVVHTPAVIEPLKNYICLAVLALFLFFPTGIAAIVKASEAQTENNSGNVRYARICNASASTLIMISIKIGALVWSIAGFVCTYRSFAYRY